MKKPLSLPRAFRRLNVRSFGFLVSTGVVLSLVLLAGSGYLWYKNIFTNSERVFYGMLERNLQTDNVTRTVVQESQSRTIIKTHNISYRPTPVVESKTQIEQIGQDRQKSTVTTRTIGLDNVEFVQYSSIQIPEIRNQENINSVLGQWAKREKNEQSGEAPQTLSDAIFMYVPFGNIGTDDREELMKQIRANGTYTLKSSKLEMDGVRPVITYRVSIDLQSLIKNLVLYIEQTGTGGGLQLNPEDYADAGELEGTMVVDVLSRHLKEISFNADIGDETFSGYGSKKRPVLPTKTITIDELQTRLQAIQ